MSAEKPQKAELGQGTEKDNGEDNLGFTPLLSPVSSQCLSLAEINQKPVGKGA